MDNLTQLLKKQNYCELRKELVSKVLQQCKKKGKKLNFFKKSMPRIIAKAKDQGVGGVEGLVLCLKY